MGPAAAAKVMGTLQAGLRVVTTISLAAATRMDLPPGYLRVVAKRHVIVFRVVADSARVVRVLHGARDIPAALDEED
jgi:plasmid stabilization system protein ParE